MDMSSLSEETLGHEIPVTGRRKVPMNMKKQISRKRDVSSLLRVSQEDIENASDDQPNVTPPLPISRATCTGISPNSPHSESINRQILTSWAARRPDLCNDTDIAEQSASRAPHATMDMPRRVGPAFRPAGKLRAQQSEQLDLGKEPHSKHKLGEGCGGIKRGPKHLSDVSPKEIPQVELCTRKCPTEDELDDSPAKRTRSHITNVPTKRSKKPNSRYANNFVWY